MNIILYYSRYVSGLTTTEIIAISITFGVGSLLLLAAIVYDYKHGRFVCPKKKKTEVCINSMSTWKIKLESPSRIYGTEYGRPWYILNFQKA